MADSTLVVACWLAILVSSASAAGPSTIVTILIDDLGSYDTQVNNPAAPTPNLGKLSHEEGLRLERFYVFKYCSPTRRSLLSGRFPVHISENQADVCSNLLPLTMEILSEKLKKANPPYMNHFVGKGHLGYQTTAHLPINRGFDSHVGYLCGQENYSYGNNLSPQHDCPGKPARCYKDMWHDDKPGTDIVSEIFYSTNWYTQQAMSIINNHNKSLPLWLHLPYQAVHGPYTDSPAWERIPSSSTFWNHTFGDMLSVVDEGIGNVTNLLKSNGMWTDAILFITSDNGGIGPGNNYPLRGMKATPWEGGTRVMGFITGGFLPSNLRGTSTNHVIHVADWYPTICNLAGVEDCTNTVVIANKSRPIDGIDQWPYITGQKTGVAHEFLPTVSVALIYQERYKIITSAQSTIWYTENCTHIRDSRTEWPCLNDDGEAIQGTPTLGGCTICNEKKPCLFDVIADPDERVNLASTNATLVKMMMDQLATYKPYAYPMTPAELANFTCTQNISSLWGNFNGPCCVPKS